VAHTCNPNYSGDRSEGLRFKANCGQVVYETPILKKPFKKKAWWSGSKQHQKKKKKERKKSKVGGRQSLMCLCREEGKEGMCPEPGTGSYPGTTLSPLSPQFPTEVLGSCRSPHKYVFSF
jgi:hypothetical protein